MDKEKTTTVAKVDKPGGVYTRMKLDTTKFKQLVIITQEVWKKIRYLCEKINDVEWSGNIWYTTEGWFNGDMTLTIKEIFLQARGTGGYVEFETDDSIVDFIEEHPEVEDMRMGLIHSHNNMGSFFSGTDDTEQSDNADHFDIYLSVITNNKGETICKVVSTGHKKSSLVYTINTPEGKKKEIASAEDSPLLYEVSPTIVIEEPLTPPIAEAFKSRVDAIIKKSKEQSTIKSYRGHSLVDTKTVFSRIDLFDIVSKLLQLKGRVYTEIGIYTSILDDYKTAEAFKAFLTKELSYESTKMKIWQTKDVYNYAEVSQILDLMNDLFVLSRCKTYVAKTLEIQTQLEDWMKFIITRRNVDLMMNSLKTEFSGSYPRAQESRFNNFNYYGD